MNNANLHKNTGKCSNDNTKSKVKKTLKTRELGSKLGHPTGKLCLGISGVIKCLKNKLVFGEIF